MATIRFGLLGHGRFGAHYERLLREIPGVELKTIATRHTATTVKDLFADPAIHAVVIATPPSTHAELIGQALGAGKHVLVEKPMVTSVAEADTVGQALEGSDRIFMVGHQYIYNDYVRALKNELPSLGTIKYFFGEHLADGPVRDDVGCFMDAGVHDLAILDYLFRLGEVQKVQGKQLTLPGHAHDDFTAASVTFANGLMAQIVTTWISPEKVRRISVIGDRGAAFYNDRAEQDKLHVGGKALLVSAGEPLRNELEHFIDCIRTGKKPLTDYGFGLRVTKQCETILQGLQTK